MIVAGFLLLFTLICVIKLMQNARVSVVTSVMSSILMFGTLKSLHSDQWIGALLIIIGVTFVLIKGSTDEHY